jgi:hypothetical protein
MFRLILFLFLMSPIAANAQTLPCFPRERLLSHIIDERGEIRLARGDAAQGAVIELYAGPGGAWSLLVLLPDGRACLLANGEGFEATQGMQPARGNPT